MASANAGAAEHTDLLAASRTGNLLKGSAASFALKVIATAATFLLTLILARLLGAQGLGIYSYVTTWAVLLAVPAVLGMDLLLLRSIPSAVAARRWAEVRGLLSFTRRSVVAASVAVTLVTGLVVWLVVGGVEREAFLVALPLVILTAQIRLNQGAMRGFHRVVTGQLAELLTRPLVTVLLVIVAAAILGSQFDAVWATGLNVIAAAAALLGGVVLLARALPSEVRNASSETHRRPWLMSAIPLAVVGGLWVANRQVDIVMLGVLAGPQATGLYTASVRSSEAISFVLFATNAGLAPVVAGLYGSREHARLQGTVTWVARLTFVASLPLSLALIVFGNQFLALFGAEFTPGYPALVVLCVAQLFNAAVGSVSLVLTMTGYERITALGGAAALALNVVLDVLLIPAFGILGAAVASTISLVAWDLLLIVVLWRRLAIDATIFGLLRAGR